MGCPPPSPGCAREARAAVWGGLSTLHLSGRARRGGGGGCAACSVPLSLSLSRWCLLSLWYPQGCLRSPRSPRRLGCPSEPPVPVSRTCGVRALHARAWCCWRRWNAFEDSLTSLPPITPSAVTHGALGGTTASCPLATFFPRLVAVFPLVSWVAGEFPSPPGPRPSTLGTPSPSRGSPVGSPPGATPPLRGCWCPSTTRPPPPHSLEIAPGGFCHSEGLGPPLSFYHSGGLIVRDILPAFDPPPRVSGGAPAGRCAPWSVFRADSI